MSVSNDVKFSYADPFAGAVVMSLRGAENDLGELLRQPSRARGLGDDDYGINLFRYAWEMNRSIFVHEWAHILQAIAYPLIYLRAARGGRAVPARWNHLKKNPGTRRLPIKWGYDEDWSASQQIATARARFVVEKNNDIRTTMDPSQRPRRGLISEHDLLEEDAQIFQYRIEIGASGTGPGYRVWLGEEPRYESAFSFLTRHISDTAALQLLPMIVRICFHTIRPLVTFARLVGLILLYGEWFFLTDGEVEDDVESMLLKQMQDDFGDANQVSTDFREHTIRDSQGVITQEQFHRIIDETPQLPLHLLAKWNQDTADEDNDFVQAVLRRPWLTYGRMGEKASGELFRYLPPMIIFTVDHPAFAARDTAGWVSPHLLDEQVPNLGVPYKDLLLEAFRVKGLSDVFLGYRKPLEVCPHTECPVHGTGLCDGWWPIPSHYEACLFPSFLEAVSGHEVTNDGEYIRPVESNSEKKG